MDINRKNNLLHSLIWLFRFTTWITDFMHDHKAGVPSKALFRPKKCYYGNSKGCCLCPKTKREATSSFFVVPDDPSGSVKYALDIFLNRRLWAFGSWTSHGYFVLSGNLRLMLQIRKPFLYSSVWAVMKDDLFLLPMDILYKWGHGQIWFLPLSCLSCLLPLLASPWCTG